MPPSRRTRFQSEKNAALISKRGVATKKEAKVEKSNLSKGVVAFLIFVMVGSTVFNALSMMVKRGSVKFDEPRQKARSKN
mmetsp:Transcript_7628/g.11445  ORF Transcript_7628/g.11445 Transcript_7628/m.11445 type:complete len:80 (+) Transcript_7628:58-297(+)